MDNYTILDNNKYAVIVFLIKTVFQIKCLLLILIIETCLRKKIIAKKTLLFKSVIYFV